MMDLRTRSRIHMQEKRWVIMNVSRLQVNSCCGLILSGFTWARLASSALIWARAPLSASIFRAKAVWNLKLLHMFTL